MGDWSLKKEKRVRSTAGCFHMYHTHVSTGGGAHVHIAHAHWNTVACTRVFHAQAYVGSIYTHILCVFCTHILQGHMWVSTWAHVWPRAVSTLRLSLVSLPSAHRHYHLPMYLQGIDRSHSWVNAAYAPGGSKAVLRRAPPYCGADPRQVPSLPDVPLHVHHPTSAWAPPTFLAAAN